MKLKNLSINELNTLASDIRNEILNVVSKNGGHLSSNLGVVELTLGMHYVFNSSKDPFIFDVSHQCYTHKILTKRDKQFCSLRKFGGICGYTNPNESKDDYFVAGHSSTSISLAVGVAKAIALKQESRTPVVLIGDGALSGGEAYEALNELGDRKYPCVIILNDNEMSIAKPVGALSKFISHAMAGSFYQKFKARVNDFLKYMPDSAAYMAKRLEEGIRLITPGMFFEELGLEYIGPINGHDISEIIATLKTAKAMKKPVIVHAQTIKGKGYGPAEGKHEKWHGVSPFNIKENDDGVEQNFNILENSENSSLENSENSAAVSKNSALKNSAEFSKISKNSSSKNSAKTATEIFSNTLLELAQNDDKIVGITAAMPSGTGLNELIEKFPNRFWDVAIAEQHATTQAAALAKEGFKPFLAIYSTFLQRAYDQIIHDVCILDLPVIFCIDRAGIVGEDGATHQGVFDISYLNAVPNMQMAAPFSEQSFKQILSFAASGENKHPLAIRYPRGKFIFDSIFDSIFDASNKALNFIKTDFVPYKSQFVAKNENKRLFIGYGNGVGRAFEVGQILGGANIVNLGFVKPLDKEFLFTLAKDFKTWYIFSASAKKGGVGEILSAFCNEFDLAVKIISFEYEDAFITHGAINEVEEALGLNATKIAQKILQFEKS